MPKRSKDVGNCPKCTSPIVERRRSNLHCLTCGLIYPDQFNLVVSPQQKLITDINHLEDLAAVLIRKCPRCNSNSNLSPVPSGLACKKCGISWRLDSSDLNRLHDKIFDEKQLNLPCPKCDVVGKVVCHANGQFECFNCRHIWDVSEKKSIVSISKKSKKCQSEKQLGYSLVAVIENDGLCPLCDRGYMRYKGGCSYCLGEAVRCNYCKSISRKRDDWVCNKCLRNAAGDQNTSSVCKVCKEGFVTASGHCCKCGAKARCCSNCLCDFEDKTQTSGICDKCRRQIGSNADDYGVKCVSCKHINHLVDSELAITCNNCEEQFCFSLPRSIAKILNPLINDGKGSAITPEEEGPQLETVNLTERDWEEAFRYKEHKQDLCDATDDLLDYVAQLKSVLQEGKDATDEFLDLERTAERLAELQSIVDGGDDEDDDLGDVWSNSDSDEDARWRAFDAEQKFLARQKSIKRFYNQVTIEDINDNDLLSEDVDWDYHDYNSICPYCRGYIGSDGICDQCDSKLDDSDLIELQYD